MARMLILGALLLVSSLASAQRFAKHVTINELPEACQHESGHIGGSKSSWSSSSSSSFNTNTGVCKLLPPVYDSADSAYDFCLKCKAGAKHGVSAEELAQSIRQIVQRKLLKANKFSTKSTLDIVIDGVKQPIDLTRVLAQTPEVLEQVGDVFFFFPNKQIGRIEYEQGQASQLEGVTCAKPCVGGPMTSSSRSASSSSRYNSNRNNIDNEDENDDEDDEEEQQQTNSWSSSSSQKKQAKKYPYSYGDSSSSSSSPYGSRMTSSQQQRRQQQQQPYGNEMSTTSSSYRTNAGRFGDQSHRSGSQQQQRSAHQYGNQEEDEEDK